jgi:hypothetical protein
MTALLPHLDRCLRDMAGAPPGLTAGQEARVNVVERDVRAWCALAVLPGRSRLMLR